VPVDEAEFAALADTHGLGEVLGEWMDDVSTL
jgi:hypothetical protein